MSLDDERVRQRFQNAPATRPASSGCGKDVRENGEFVAAESGEGVHRFMVGMPADRVTLPDRLAQPFRNVGQEHVAHRVAERIVDDFEAIQVDKQRGEVLVVSRGIGDGI